ncbi:hypothetical protein B0F90DRAFT_1730877 [Multifurca ochricompacta]|uniref:F-box domain-containing protein n=1 Tax=Multifurca ochricompacta TaxID=376703 RepID=A0AAD4QMM3_9AGAM|nr:hypothetical protein B0F90DRAFT_1730877 [Multifurca ochricompacta]
MHIPIPFLPSSLSSPSGLSLTALPPTRFLIMSIILSLPEELIIEIMMKGDHRIVLTCQRVCRALNAIIRDSLALQYLICLAACGMQDGLFTVVCKRTAERLEKLREYEAAWREVAWSDGGIITHRAARNFPTAISGGVLAFLNQSDGSSGDPEFGDQLFLLRIPSKLRGIPGGNWELNGLGEMSNVCIDSAQDLLLFQRACNLHVRALSSGKVHPLVHHSGTFNLCMGSSDVLGETPVICCEHVAALVHEHGFSQATLTIKGTIMVWNWRTGNQIAIIRPSFARIGRDIAFLDETHLLIPASEIDSALQPGQNYELMLLLYDFEPSATVFVNQVATIPYCFRITLPVRTGFTTFRQARISANTASFSSPVPSSPQGYFHADPRDRIITLEVTDNNWMQGIEETAELYAPVRTFLNYIASHPPSGKSTSARGPVDVPWGNWGPYGAHLVRAADQPYIIRRPRACGMRVLSASSGKESVVVTDYHPGRVARSSSSSSGCGGDGDEAGPVDRPPNANPSPSQGPSRGARPRGLSTFSEIQLNARLEQQRQRQPRARLPLVCVTKEVPLPRELQCASESPWTMLCEDALLAFEYVPDGFEISRVFAYTF